MIVVGEDGFSHEIETDLEDGRGIAKCQKIILNLTVMDTETNCPRCKDPSPTVVAVPKRSGTPRVPKWKPAKDPVREANEALKQANRCVVASVEWLQRGEPGQFMDNVLDQAHMAYRFLGELLAVHKRIEPPEDYGEEAD